MSTEAVLTREIPDTIPLEERNNFQILLMKKMLAENASPETEFQWADAYGKKVSEIIDNRAHEYIRELIMDHSYEKAAEEILKLL